MSKEDILRAQMATALTIARRKSGLTQIEFGRKVKLTAFSICCLEQYANGITPTRIPTLSSLIRALLRLDYSIQIAMPPEQLVLSDKDL